MKRECPECGELFEGRIDKKFCCDQCRNTFNNRQNKDANNFCRNVNRILRNNRRVLEEFMIRSKSKTSKDKLIQAGFNFDYMTNIYKTKTGKVYYFCYDYGYFESENRNITIVVRKEYVD